MRQTFAEKVIEFNENLSYTSKLPKGFRVLNPYSDNPETMEVMQQFYHKYYNDNKKRKFMIGINPSRHGAGLQVFLKFNTVFFNSSSTGFQLSSA